MWIIRATSTHRPISTTYLHQILILPTTHKVTIYKIIRLHTKGRKKNKMSMELEMYPTVKRINMNLEKRIEMIMK